MHEECWIAVSLLETAIMMVVGRVYEKNSNEWRRDTKRGLSHDQLG